jgi:hypothetical protein
MTIRTRLKSWLCANSLLAALASSHHALAAHPQRTAVASAPSSPKTEPVAVKPSAKRIPALGVLGAGRPLRLQLTEVKPLPVAKSTRNEILWHGLRIPTIIAFGLSGLSAGGALATGFAASRGNDPRTCDSSCSEHDVRQRALLLTTGVLTGMAAAGIGIGITFMVKAPKSRAEPAVRPRFDATISGQKAIAKVGWAFSSF